MSLSTPVAFLIFNRPDLTEIVFETIAQAKPKKLLIVADGPRFPEEAEKCEKARAVIEKVNWDCQIFTNFSKTNLGCKKRIISGLEWVFSEFEEAIILEDDCLPSNNFFLYCQTLLEHYRNEPRITSISGCNLGFYDPTEKSSYRYSRFMNMWGWATWRRTFKLIDFEMKFWNFFRNSAEFNQALDKDKRWIDYWKYRFDKTFIGEVDTWDYQWILSNLYHKGLVVSPTVNLIKNLGYRSDATHTIHKNGYLENLQINNIALPLVHPPKFKISKKYENYIKYAWCGIYSTIPLKYKIKNKVKRVVGSVIK